MGGNGNFLVVDECVVYFVLFKQVDGCFDVGNVQGVALQGFAVKGNILAVDGNEHVDTAFLNQGFDFGGNGGFRTAGGNGSQNAFGFQCAHGLSNRRTQGIRVFSIEGVVDVKEDDFRIIHGLLVGLGIHSFH